MILETTLKNENVTYSRALRGMTVQEIEEAVRATVLDGHDDNTIKIGPDSALVEKETLWTMREFMQGIVHPLVRRYQRWVDDKPEGYWEVDRPAYCEALHEATETEIKRITGEVARRLIDMYARM